MATIYFDCSSGVSSDMALGALIHLGADADEVASELRGLRPAAERAGIALGEFRLRVRTAGRQGV
ncbi:MAG: LarC family nickel insertion protein, partial [Clostridiales Family XIII bacterium]|nr:LarC family nickel insertion protein [Clostridiales Family XIII bacterium]